MTSRQVHVCTAGKECPQGAEMQSRVSLMVSVQLKHVSGCAATQHAQLHTLQVCDRPVSTPPLRCW